MTDSPRNTPIAGHLYEKGLAALRRRDAALAERQALTALEFDPNHADASALLGAVLSARSDHVAALPWLAQAVLLAPRRAQYHYNLGAAQHALANWHAAMRSYRRALALQPEHVQARSNYADLLRRHGRPIEALAHFETLLRIAPETLGLPLKLALTYFALKSYELAEAWFEQSVQTTTEPALVQWEYAQYLLLRKRFKAGWAAYEHRGDCARFNGVHHFPYAQPLWRGEPLHGKTVLIYREQGLGDEIMFGSLIAAATAEAKRVLIVAAPAMLRLWQHTFATTNLPTDRVHVHADWGAQPPQWSQPPAPSWLDAQYVDYQCSMGRLAYLTRPTLASFSSPQVSLRVPEEMVNRWRDMLGSVTLLLPKLRVGVMWASHPSGHSFDSALRAQRKNMPLLNWLPLAQLLPGLQFISLANTDHAAQIANLPELGLADFSPQLQDLADTAALMKNLDLVITIDTSVAHLAGALGMPVWVLLCWDADWRWGEHDSRSDWYPYMRLLRQQTPGDWAPVVESLVRDLRDWLRCHPGR